MRSFLILVTLLCLAAPAGALAPAEVLVVANAAVPDSLELAKAYAHLRAIPDENVVALEPGKTVQISREQYEQQVRQPLLAILKERKLEGRIRCILLVYGMPLHVGPAKADASPLDAAIRDAHLRLAVDYELLQRIGRDIPKVGDGETALDKLFESPLPQPAKPLKPVDELMRGINLQMGLKQAEVLAFKEADRKALALRQLMTLHQDVYGLEGLINFIKTAKPDKAPPLEPLQKELDREKASLLAAATQPAKPEGMKLRLERTNRLYGAAMVVTFAPARPRNPEIPLDTDAALDSELALLYCGEYPLESWLPNPLQWKAQAQIRLHHLAVPHAIMTCRLDGPGKACLLKLMKDTLAAEDKGLAGQFCIDAGGKVPAYDEHLLALHALLKQHTTLRLTLDTETTLLPPGSCPDTALYVGWYSLKHYIPAFTWNTGAVGWHIASFEAQDLRDPKSEQWCPQMLQRGVVATLGAAQEPRLAAFPPPEEFFPLLLTGKYTLAECYWRTVPLVSWRMMLLGDPLYNPFQKNPAMKVEALRPGLAP